MPYLYTDGIPDYNESGVYMISNSCNGKVYVGSATLLRRRMAAHRSYLRIGKHDNEHLQRAWCKYGEAAFSFKIVEVCSEDMLLIREQHWIDTLGATNRAKGYNISVVVGFAMLGRKHSDESKELMSVQRKGIVPVIATAAAAKANKGKKRPAYIGEIVSITMKGKKKSKEHREKIVKNHWSRRPDAAEIAARCVANRPQTLTEEHKMNIAAGLRRRGILHATNS